MMGSNHQRPSSQRPSIASTSHSPDNRDDDGDSLLDAELAEGISGTTPVEERATDHNKDAPSDGWGVAANQTRAIGALRAVFLLAVLGSGCAVTISIYILTCKVVQTNNNPTTVARVVQTIVSERLVSVLSSLELLATDIALQVEHDVDSNNTSSPSWPFVTIHDFERRASRVSDAHQLSSLWLVPRVNNESRMEWCHFAVTSRENWLQESWDDILSPNINTTVSKHNRQLEQKDTPHNLCTLGVGQQANATSETGVLLPLWQTSPPLSNTSLYDVDVRSLLPLTMSSALWNGLPVLGESVIPSQDKDSTMHDILAREGDGRATEPVLIVAVPIQDHNSTMTPATLVAIVRWSALLEDAVLEEGGAICTVSQLDTCFQFQSGTGAVTYLGTEVCSVSSPSQMSERIDVNASTQALWSKRPNALQLATSGLSYEFRVIPTRTAYMSFVPLVSAVILVLFLVAVTLLFLAYDCLVQHRQKKVAMEAIRSSQIVKSLFPAGVRDRLFQQATQSTSSAADNTQNDFEYDGDTSESSETLVMRSSKTTRVPPKRRLRHFLRHHHSAGHLHPDASTVVTLSHNDKQKPIADLFPSCTVLFADIAGFTAWSSERDPTQVFTLLQQLYAAMDAVARKLGVFKVSQVNLCASPNIVSAQSTQDLTHTPVSSSLGRNHWGQLCGGDGTPGSPRRPCGHHGPLCLGVPNEVANRNTQAGKDPGSRNS